MSNQLTSKFHGSVRSSESSQATFSLEQVPQTLVRDEKISVRDYSGDSDSADICKILIRHPTFFYSDHEVLSTIVLEPPKPVHHWRIQCPYDYLKKSQQRDTDFAQIAGRLILQCLAATLDVWMNQHAPNGRPPIMPLPTRPEDGDRFLRLKADRELYERCIMKLKARLKISKFQAGDIVLAVTQELLKAHLSREVARMATSHAEFTSNALD